MEAQNIVGGSVWERHREVVTFGRKLEEKICETRHSLRAHDPFRESQKIQQS